MSFKVTIEADSLDELTGQLIDAAKYFGVGGFTVQAATEPELWEGDPTPEEAAPANVHFPPFAGTQGGTQIEEWPQGKCPKHDREWKKGTYGLYCTAKDPTGPKGYCVLRPGDIYNGKRAA